MTSRVTVMTVLGWGKPRGVNSWRVEMGSGGSVLVQFPPAWDPPSLVSPHTLLPWGTEASFGPELLCFCLMQIICQQRFIKIWHQMGKKAPPHLLMQTEGQNFTQICKKFQISGRKCNDYVDLSLWWGAKLGWWSCWREERETQSEEKSSFPSFIHKSFKNQSPQSWWTE